MPVCKISEVSSKDRSDPTSGWSQFEIYLEGRGNRWETIQRRVGNLSDIEGPIFVTARDESGGSPSAECRVTLGGAAIPSISNAISRDASARGLAPGTKVCVAMDAPTKRETIHFELELPATVEAE
jgi:hypothetical protein